MEEATASGGPQFDVILMDMCMPVLGGVEATQVRCSLPLVLARGCAQLGGGAGEGRRCCV